MLATSGRLAVFCSGCVIFQALATRGWLSAGRCTLPVTLGRLADVCGVCVNSVSYIRKVGGCLQGVCNLSGTFDLHETGWRFSAGCVLTLSVA